MYRDDFLQKVLDEIFCEGLNLNSTEQKLLIEKFIDLYDDGCYNSEADTNIQSGIYEFIQGFIYYKLNKDNIMED